ncbi:uncharacterized protein LOC133915133 [Phragmites australis]|uniref:uncharacterized protein LOC133915133 n=1 Tax=Phragmites australis TaxID=29695 RepID=UPI002D79E165|nr:uncharacterized protein LOC133915133 [Phragmites australis]XP_062214145.1 uncharacterized protein LOC133915133 [Phragmites australis]XP_062214147.1 uncharacterized protein LOC133915133 [Phragmites australis]
MANASKHLQPSSKAGNDKKYQGTLVASPAKAISPKCVKHIVPSKQLILNGDTISHVASFLVKVVALEAVRRVSKARCPFIWNYIQALQILVYPPFSWIQRWAPLKFVVQGIQKLSMPLLFLSGTTTLSEWSAKRDDEPGSNIERPETPSEANEIASTSSTRDVADGTKDIVPENWLALLFRELEKQGITLPERFTEDELHRFYVAANGDFSCLLSSVKKTIRWRETFHILTLQELDLWSHLVFWHGFDTMLRPCLVIHLGLACSSIPPCDIPRFGQALVSQIDHGVVNLTNEEDPRITVLMDCHGISPFRFPMQMMRSFITVVEENYPNRLGVLCVVRLPPVVRVIAQTLTQVLKPSTKQKLRFEGDSYKKTLAEFLQIVPAFLGGKCSCSQCEKPRDSSVIQAGEGSKSQPHQISVDGGSPVTDFDFDEAEIVSPYSCENAIRAAIIGLLMVCIFIAFHAGMNDTTSVPASV